MKCDKCGYMSFDYNLVCPVCNKDLTLVRRKLGVFYEQPEVGFDEFFTGASASYKPAASAPQEEAELDLDSGEEFEFTLDD
ncbi:MAG TPA: hypothetical protein VK463_02870 [Desulfomonilaceae bacterium]|nr:hypothetical protein [Desulfomonilaceae bacterium]